MTDHDHVRTEDEDGELKNKRTSGPKLRELEVTDQLTDPSGTTHTGEIGGGGSSGGYSDNLAPPGTGDRQPNTAYTNDTGGPLFVVLTASPGGYVAMVVDGVDVTVEPPVSAFAIVPEGSTYEHSGNPPDLAHWHEKEMG